MYAHTHMHTHNQNTEIPGMWEACGNTEFEFLPYKTKEQ